MVLFGAHVFAGTIYYRFKELANPGFSGNRFGSVAELRGNIDGGVVPHQPPVEDNQKARPKSLLRLDMLLLLSRVHGTRAFLLLMEARRSRVDAHELSYQTRYRKAWQNNTNIRQQRALRQNNRKSLAMKMESSFAASCALTW